MVRPWPPIRGADGVAGAGIVARMEFRIARTARDRYALDGGYFSSRDQAADGPAARRAAWQMARTGGTRPDRPVTAGDLAAMAIIHELQHRAIDQAHVVVAAPVKGGPRSWQRSRTDSRRGPCTATGSTPGHYLQARTDDAPNELLTTEELLLLWVANRNPAFMRYDDLFDEQELADTTDYPRVVAAIRKQVGQGR